MPGKIIQAMKKAKTSNPLILLDEIDKMSQDFRGDPASALLDVLDPEQNKSFNDHFIEVDYDLSGVMFLATANSLDMPRPLLDRMEIIRLSGYTDEEKLHIAKQYLIPKQSKVHALKASELSIQDDAIMNVINQYTKEAGVRSLERAFAKMMRKTVYKILQDKDIKSIDINSSNLKDFLGVHKFDASQIETDNKIGITNGLAYTEVGGDLLALEAVKMHGKGEVKITGTLGDVMKESVQAALSYIRSRSSEFGIKPDAFKDIDIHLHVPEGATPKDGPSAGVGIATSIVSVLTSIPVKRSVAMTGEITLRGRVLAIGGLKEKMLAALRGGVTTVLIPKENIKDLEDIPDNIKNGLEIIPVESVNEVFKVALTDAFKPIEDDGTASVQKSLVKKIGSNSKSKARLEH